MEFKKQHTLFAYLAMIGLAILTALNYQIFILYNAFAPSGINGLATMAQYLFHISIGYLSLIINLPLAAFVFFKVDKQFALKTLTFVLAFSAGMLLFQNWVDLSRFIYHTSDGRSTILAPIASGTINGLIYGAAIRLGGSTGGADFIARYVHKRRPEYSMMRIIFAFNVVIAGISYFVYNFNIEPVILCILYSFITSKVSDSILKGGEQALKVEMITKHPHEITQALIEGLHHSVTILNAEGGYSRENKTMLVCIINKHQITRLTEIIREFPDTFACVTDVSKTLGNFKRIGR
ncbi:MAG: YitT family protein [Clostridia bacterium]